MAIRTSIQPFLFYRDIVLAVLCAVFGAWGWYDYTITIPKRYDAFIEYSTLREAKDGFEKRVNDRQSLSEADEKEFQRVKVLLNEKYTEVPSKPESYDDDVQFWLYFVGCGLLGTPWAIWSLIQLKRRSFAVTDDGTLITPEGSCPIDRATEIDMSRWMSKSIAVVTLESGAQSLMDDYKYRNTHLIVGAIAHRLYPDKWTAEAKVVKNQVETAEASGSA
ncbi:MAG: hypothetical protein JNL80_01365 [Phycisphaerae bacterium]|jgi:hypothetical protein|nr:hypothetical protein [Phycisphaerae bacterium]